MSDGWSPTLNPRASAPPEMINVQLRRDFPPFSFTHGKAMIQVKRAKGSLTRSRRTRGRYDAT
jgi:hypothetical protein